MKKRALRIIPCRTLALLIWMVPLFVSPLSGQDSGQTTTETSAEEEELTTAKTRMSLAADQHPDGMIVLKGLLRARIDGSYQKVAQKQVQFFVLNTEGEEQSLGDTLSGADGIAVWRISKSNLTPGAEGAYSFLARFDGDELMDGSESDLILHPATLTMETAEEDSMYMIRITAQAESAEGPVAIAEAPVALYVKRMFSSLKVAEGETDENGMMEIEFPSGLSGDQDANLYITAMIEETEAYGNLTASTTQQWGKAVSYEIEELPKALWSPHPPVWMMVTFFILMGTVWGHYAYIVFSLFRIKGEKPQESN